MIEDVMKWLGEKDESPEEKKSLLDKIKERLGEGIEEALEWLKEGYEYYQSWRDAMPPGVPPTGYPPLDEAINIFNFITSTVEKLAEEANRYGFF